MLTDRYPTLPGQMRLDESDNAAEGRCIDSWVKPRAGGGRVQHFFFRNNAGDIVQLVMEPQEITAFRDGLNRILLSHGVEREVTLQVPA